MKPLSLIILCFLCLSLPTWAGVVEDAEEELKKLRKEQGVTRPIALPPGGGAKPTSTRAPGNAESDSKPATRNGGRTSVKSGEGTGGRTVKTAPVTEEDKSSEKPRRRPKARDKSDLLLSIFGVLALLILVGLGAWFGSRGEIED